MALATDEIKIKNLINTYDTLTREQVEVLANLKTGQQKKLIDKIINKKAIRIDYLDDGIEVCCNFYVPPNKKFVLIGEVLKKLLESSNLTVLWFQKQEYPFTAIACIKDKIFDIAVVEEDTEHIFNAVINRVIASETGSESDNYVSAPAPRENILIIIENKEQIKKINIIHQNTVFAYVNIQEQIVEFVK